MADKRDLLIHFDEDAQRFIFYSVRVADTAVLREATFDGVCPEVAFFKGKAPDEAERALGGMVFSLLDLGSITKVNIRNYKAEADSAMNEWVEELEVAAKANDPDAQYSLFMEYHSRTLKLGQLGDLQRAEELLFASAKGGNANAIKSLEDWPLLKAAAERRIARGPAV